MNASTSALIDPWPGPYGGLPPWDRIDSDAFDDAVAVAIADKRRELAAIVDDQSSPTFANTIEALEDCGRALQRVRVIVQTMAQTMGTGAIPAIAQRLAPLIANVDNEIAHDSRLFARIDAVHRRVDALGLDAVQRRLVERWRDRMLRAGVALAPDVKARLVVLHARYAELFAAFARNLAADERQVVWIESEGDLAGTTDDLMRTLKQAAIEEGRPGAWAVKNMRAMVWPFLTQSTRRDFRERVWRMWTDRGGHEGPNDNRPIVAEILSVRGEIAKLLGFPTFAHYALADRMAGTPERVLETLERAWGPVLVRTRAQVAAYQAIANADGAGIVLAPWDRLHYADRHRRLCFGFDGEALRPYLALDRMFGAMFWAAGRLHGIAFDDITARTPLLDDSVRVYAVTQDGEPHGVLYVDLFARSGKGHGSYQTEWRTAESFRGRVLPISCIVSNISKPAPGEPVLLAWEYANVFFHEFGHALHILMNRVQYPSLGSLSVPWDFIELPSLINERWLSERELLARFARHHASGEAVPEAMLDALERSLADERIFSVNLDYLADAFIDLRLHLLADGSGTLIDPVAVESETLEALSMPAAWDLVMRVPNFWHAWTESYAAGLYVYLWADVMAADAAEAFATAPDGWYDRDVAKRWRETVLSVGASVSAEDAFRAFRGRDPDPDALLRRFGLVAA